MIRTCVMFSLMTWVAFAQTPIFIRAPPVSGHEPLLWMAQTETTVEQFAAFVKVTGYQTEAEKAGSVRTWKTPGFPVSPKQPVVYVTPVDAKAYCEFLGGRLPTDPEWEYAARAGATTRHYWGDTLDDRYLWWRGNSNDSPQPVAKKRPNAWGLYDVEGNVWEWSVPLNVKGEPLANRRGGSWVDCEDVHFAEANRTVALIGLSRYFKVPLKLIYRHDDIGFRCARSEP